MRKSLTKCLLFVGVMQAFFSCNSVDDAEKIQQKIKEKKDKISEIKAEITDLESQLKKIDSTLLQTDKTVVKVVELRYQEFDHSFNITSNIESIHEAFISPELNAQITDIYVSEGDYVKKGQLLARLNTIILQNSLQEIEKGYDMAKTLYDKQKELWDKKIGSEIEYLRAKNNMESMKKRIETTRSQINMANIRAPFSGYVDEIFQKEGELGVPGRQLLRLVNIKELKLSADVSESYLQTIQKGDSLLVRFPVLNNEKQKVVVARTGKIIDPQSRTFKVEAMISNKNEKIKPNMTVSVSFTEFSTDSALLVPSVLVKEDLKGFYVYTAIEKENKTIVRKQYVDYAFIDDGVAMITNGLEAGDKVITEGYNTIVNGAEVRIKE